MNFPNFLGISHFLGIVLFTTILRVLSATLILSKDSRVLDAKSRLKSAKVDLLIAQEQIRRRISLRVFGRQ